MYGTCTPFLVLPACVCPLLSSLQGFLRTALSPLDSNYPDPPDTQFFSSVRAFAGSRWGTLSPDWDLKGCSGP